MKELEKVELHLEESRGFHEKSPSPTSPPSPPAQAKSQV